MRIPVVMRYSRVFAFCCACWFASGCGAARAPMGEYQYGFMAAEQLISEHGQSTDPAHLEYLRYLEQRLVRASPNVKDDHVQYKFILLGGSAPMAYAPGGGFILFSKKLVRSLDNEAELAFILCHEIAHQHLGHTKLAIEASVDLQPVPYQKSLELEADRYALGLMALAGYDPRYAVMALSRSYRALDHIPQDTEYPDLETRLGAISEEIRASDWQPPGTIDRREFQKLRTALQ
jgi:predicted Zn-dependent protease